MGRNLRVLVALIDDDVTLLTTDPEPYLPPDSSVGIPEVLSGPDGTFVTYANGSRDGVQAWMWALDDPCTRLDVESPAPPAQAPPASPIAAEAQLTG